jgi:hypothetical protein
VTKFKEYTEKARKIHQRLQLIFDFEEATEPTEKDPDFIKQKEIQQLINSLKMQQEFLFEFETTSHAYLETKTRAE